MKVRQPSLPSPHFVTVAGTHTACVCGVREECTPRSSCVLRWHPTYRHHVGTCLRPPRFLFLMVSLNITYFAHPAVASQARTHTHTHTYTRTHTHKPSQPLHATIALTTMDLLQALRRSIKGDKEKPQISIAPKSAIAIVPPKKVGPLLALCPGRCRLAPLCLPHGPTLAVAFPTRACCRPRAPRT
jgi:hypothetical protein